MHSDFGATVVELRDLTISYGRTSILSKADVRIPDATFVSIIGRSGSGKSSLLYCMAGLLRPSEGSVVFAGEDLWRLSDARRSRLRAREMGFLFQDYVLDSTRSVLDNILEPLAYAGTKLKPSHVVQAEALIAEVGVDVPTSRRPGEISGGQAQRIALCRAMVGDPSLLIADEPTGSLDEESASAIIGAMQRRLRSESSRLRAVVMVTHDRDLAFEGDIVLEVRPDEPSTVVPLKART